MSNLSDLLPAGAGAKVITATADGNLATGQTVILQSDGTVKAVTEVAHSENIGSAVTYEASGQAQYSSVVFDPDSNKVIVAYRDDGNSGYGTAVVGTVSGNSISFGTAVVFESASSNYIDTSYDTGEDKVLVAYQDAGDSNKGKAIVGTVSGTSISFGTALAVEDNSGPAMFMRVAYSPDAGKHLYIYSDGANSSRGAARLITVSGTSATRSNPEVVFETNSVQDPMDVVYDTTNDKFVLAYNDNNTRGRTKVATVSGSSITFTGGSAWDLTGSLEAETIRLAFDSNLSKVVIAYKDKDNYNRGFAVVGEVSGTDFNTGTKVEFEGGVTDVHSVVFDSASNKVVIQYRDQSNSDYGQYVVGTPTAGNSISFATPVVITNYNNDFGGAAFDSNAGRTVFALSDSDNNLGKAYVLQLDGTTSNSSNFVGITNQAINNSASGEVVAEGGVITNGSLLPLTYSGSLGAEASFQTGIGPDYISSCFDSSSGKTIISYVGPSNYGYVVVGTPNASDNTITFGTPVAYNSNTTDANSITYDVAQNKVLIAYANGGNSYYIWGVVGTVSGTSISLGTASAQTSAASDGEGGISTVYEANAAKHVLAFKNGSSSNRLDAQVMTISGTSVSSGSALTNIAGGQCAYISTAYDSSAQKVVIAYQDTGSSTHGKAVVATVSGTSISAGSEVSFNAAVTYNTVTEYDPSANKIIIVYKNNQTPTAVVGTVSGTSISFGSATVISSQSGSDSYGGTFDTTVNKIVFAFRDEDTDPDTGKYAIGTVSGTSITFTTPANYNTSSSRFNSPSYNATADRTVISFRNADSGGLGTSVVLQLTGATTNFTIGSTYYVQDDGTLATTSSSVTAGKAIANTTLLLKG